MRNPAPSSIDAYIAGFPPPVQKILKSIRATIRKEAPAAQETIKYAIPTFTLHGNLVHFAAYDHHIGFYPGPDGIIAFQKELAPYKSAKGSVQFPLDRPVPLSLIAEITRYRVLKAEESGKGKEKKAPARA